MTQVPPVLYLLTRDGCFFGAHANERHVVIGTQDVAVVFALRKQLELSAARRKPFARTAYAIRDNPHRAHRNRRWTFGLTSDHAPYRADANARGGVGICRCEFELSKRDNPLTRLLTVANSDVFVTHWVKYDAARDILQVHGERLSSAEYLTGAASVSYADHLERSYLEP